MSLRFPSQFPNPIDALRTRNIFNPPPPLEPLTRDRRRFVDPLTEPTPNPFMRSPRESEAEKYWNEMNHLQTNVGPGVQAYRDYLKRMPVPEDYKPSWLTRIASGLGGFGSGVREGAGAGIETAMGLNRSGYMNAMKDYANEGVGLREVANLEQDELDSKLKALQAARAFGLNYDKYELARLQAENKMDVDTANAQSARIRAEAYAERNRRAGFNTFPQEDGSVLYVNQNDPSDTHIVPARTVQAGQLQVARGQLGVARTNAAANVRRTNAYERGVNADIEQGVERNKLTARGLDMREGGTYFNRGTQRPVTPRAQEDANNFALRQMMTDPAFSDFIELDDQGFPIPVEDDGSPDYQDFLEALDARVAEILKGNPARRGGGRGGGAGR